MTRSSTPFWYPRALLELRPQQLLPDITIGLMTGLLGVLFDLSFAALIFSNALADHLAAGAGFVLFSAAVTRVIIALLSSSPIMVADLGTVPTAILAWSAGMVANQLPNTATSAELLVTVIATIALTSLLTGLALYGLGILRLGSLVGLLPRSVVGGFVASTGWLLVNGAFKIMVGSPLSVQSLAVLGQPHSFIQWVPGLLLAVYLLAIARRQAHPLVMSGSLIAAVGLFYLVLPLAGPTGDVTLGIPGFATPWQTLRWGDLLHINWNAIVSQWMCSGTVIVTAAITLMMNIKGVALVAEREIDTNYELKVAGLTNILIGLAGGILSYHSMNKSVLAYKMGSRRRLVTLISAAVFFVLPTVGAPLLSQFPKPILGGLLLYLGLSLLVKWVYSAWKTSTKLDYCVVQLIWLVSATVGFLQGLTVGWGLALLLVVGQQLQSNYRRFSHVWWRD